MNTEIKTTRISVLGSCVSRDVFEICKDSQSYCAEKENEYIVDGFVQSVSPVAAVFPPLDEAFANQLIEDSKNSDAVNFYKRNFSLDITNKTFDYLAEKKTDWLIIDLSCLRGEVRKFNDAYISYLIEASIAEKFQGGLPNSFARLNEGEIIDLATMNKDFLKTCYFKYFDKLKEMYPENRIIVLDIKFGFLFQDDKKTDISRLYRITEEKQKRENDIISFAYECAKEYLKDAHFVDMPPVLICDTNHKWGQNGLHYVKDVYMYFYRCVDAIINSGLDADGVAEYITEQQLEYSKNMFSQFADVLNESIRNRRNVLNHKMGTTPGKYSANGLELCINENYSFTLTGKAEKDTILYLYAGTKNPIGEWSSVKENTEPGVYYFSSGFQDKNVKAQLVLATEQLERKWVSGNTRFRIDQAHAYKLVRLIITAGADVNISSTIELERIS